MAIEKIDIQSDLNSIVTLYQAVNWVVYTKDTEKLKRALLNSSYLYGYYQEDQLIGLIRGVSDGEFINYIQDIIILPNHQNKGIGSILLEFIQEEFSHVRAQILLTDDQPSQLAFYEKNKFKNTKDFDQPGLNSFVIFNS